MSWTRSSDNAATYPPLMQVAGMKGADDRIVNEIFGFVWRCACQSAAHLTDYAVDVGTANMLGGSPARAAALVKICVKAGVFTPRVIDGVKSYVIVQDPDFIHLLLAEEVQWSRQQRNDTRDHSIKVPVLRRDGDQCRWCGKLVQWRGKRTNRTGTLDHLNPGEAGTPETMHVACLGCNSGRKDNKDLWDDNHQIRPAPTNPKYGKTTADYLTNHGYPTTFNVLSDGTTPALAGGADPAPSSVRPATPPAAQAPHPRECDPMRPETWKPPTGSRPEVAAKSTPVVDERSLAGSGRDGNGLGSNPHQGTASTLDDAPAARPRRRRGKRGGRTSRPSTPRES